MANAFEIFIGDEKLKKAFQKAIEEIELKAGLTIAECVSKQIPETPKGILCPVCDSELKYYYVPLDDPDFKVLVKDDYCAVCGQKIDWIEDDV